MPPFVIWFWLTVPPFVRLRFAPVPPLLYGFPLEEVQPPDDVTSLTCAATLTVAGTVIEVV